jgi:flagellar basal-body rod protein FlgC
MSISAVMGISLSGMRAQQTRLAASADNIANALTPGYDRRETRLTSAAPGGVVASVAESGQSTFDDSSNVDLATEMLSLVQSELDFRANAAVWESGADIWDVINSIKRS